jgi:hypothetical protein
MWLYCNFLMMCQYNDWKEIIYFFKLKMYESNEKTVELSSFQLMFLKIHSKLKIKGINGKMIKWHVKNGGLKLKF